MAVVKNTYQVKGMGCAACVNKIERALAGKEGIKYAKIDFGDKMLTIEYDDQKTNTTEISQTVESLGYELLTR